MVATRNLKDIVDEVASRTGITKKDTKAAVKATLEGVADFLRAGDSVAVAGFGGFHVRKSAPRKGRDLRTGEEIDIPARPYVRFKASKRLLAGKAK